MSELNELVPAMFGFAATILAVMQTFLPSDRRARQYKLVAIDFYEVADEANSLADFEREDSAETATSRQVVYDAERVILA